MFLMIRCSIALILLCVVVIKCEPNSEQSGYTASGVKGHTGSKTKKIQIVYIKVPLSKVLESPSDGYSTGERGYSEGGGNGVQGYQSPSGIPGEGRPHSYVSNNIGVGGNGYNGVGGYAENFDASNQQTYDVKPNAPEGYGSANIAYGAGYGNEGGNAGPGYGNNVPKDQMNYQNDGNLGLAYGAAVGNALPQNPNYEDNSYGHESQNTGFPQNNQINYDQNNGYVQNPQYTRPHSDGYGVDNYEKGKQRKPHYPKMMVGYRPQIPIMATLPAFTMKGFAPAFGTNFASFGGQPFGGMGGITGSQGISGISGMSGMSGITGSMKGFGGFKNKLSMLLGNKFGMGGAGGLLGGMMGWD